MISLWRTFRLMLRHPLGRKHKISTLVRFIRWQLGSRLLGASVAMPFIRDTRLLICTGMQGATMNIYVGLQEFEDMAFSLHLLRSQDMFIDIGANVGVYSVLAAGACNANVIAIEPVPSSYEALLDNINLNRLGGRVSAQNIGIASANGELRFSALLGPTNHVLRPEEKGVSVIVPVKTLDTVSIDASPVLIKIDVEGFEQEVLRGGRNLLSNQSLLAIVIELNGLGSRYGFDDHTADTLLRDFGFVPARYLPFKRKIIEISAPNSTGNTLYIRPSVELNDRLHNAEKIKVQNVLF